MHFLKKINKGALLSAIVLIGVIIYLVAVSINNNAQKPKLKSLSEEFINKYSELMELPEELQDNTKKITDKQIQDYEKKVKAELDAYYPKDYINISVSDLVSNLTTSNEMNIRIINADKNIKSYNFIFDGNSVKIDMEVENTIDYINSEGIKSSFVDTYNDSINFIKENGEWKVVYYLSFMSADYLNNATNGNMYNDTYIYAY